MSIAPHSPRRRIGVVLTGSGTAGAYHAGVLRAIAESGIQVDVIAAHGAGVLTGLAAAIDGGARIWDAGGPWTDPRLRRAYRFRPALAIAGWALLACLLLLLTPLVVLVLAAAAYGLATVASLVGLTGLAATIVGWYAALLGWLFDPPMMPTIVPRLLVLGVLVVAGVLAVAAVRAVRAEPARRRNAGAFWWQLLGWPLDAAEPSATAVSELWRLVHGAAGESRPNLAELGRRYVDVLTDNFGQPGFHEVLVAVHDLDAGRDLVGSVLSASGRAAFERRRPGVDDRQAEIVDFTGPQRDALGAFLAGAFRLPVVTAPATVEFAPDSYWRGERHRICDRPDLAVRLVDELAALGMEQIVLVSAAPASAGPHALVSAPVALRTRMGEIVRSFEAAAATEAAVAARSRGIPLVVVRPDHNPVGPFDFEGVYDERSDRRRTVAELLQLGYADAYHHLIEPMVAAAETPDALA
ncbi:MAG: hypothetical protein DIU54_001950 [Acidobacteriota bacterium]